MSALLGVAAARAFARLHARLAVDHERHAGPELLEDRGHALVVVVAHQLGRRTRGVSDRSEMPYMGPMKENPTHPYMLDVAKLPDGRFQWAIRERGKLLQRSDRLHPSEPAAREHGFKAIEGLLGHATQDHRRR